MTLSIITINYNNRDGLQKTIDSVLAQTWTDYEWIVIDGGSTDGSKELIEHNQEHFAYWCSEPDRGVYNAMNKGIAKAQGDYLNFMNSGDSFYEAETLQKVFGEKRTTDILYGDWMEIYQHEDVLRQIPLSDLKSTLWRQNICHQAMFISTRILKQNGYDESMKILADWLWNNERALEGVSFEHIDTTICNYDMYGMSSTIQDECKSQECERIMALYPSYMQHAIQEINKYQHDKYVQIVRELLGDKGLLAITSRCTLDLLYLLSRIKNHIFRRCNHKS